MHSSVGEMSGNYYFQLLSVVLFYCCDRVLSFLFLIKREHLNSFISTFGLDNHLCSGSGLSSRVDNGRYNPWKTLLFLLVGGG